MTQATAAREEARCHWCSRKVVYTREQAALLIPQACKCGLIHVPYLDELGEPDAEPLYKRGGGVTEVLRKG